MSIRYKHLLSPLKVGNMVLKNRMTAAPSTPHFLQGIEEHYTEKMVTHFANRARNGAALVTINHLKVDMPHMPVTEANKREIDMPGGHFNMCDMYDPTCQTYICQMLDAIHYYGGKATAYDFSPQIGMGGGPSSEMDDFEVSTQPQGGPEGPGGPMPGGEMSGGPGGAPAGGPGEAPAGMPPMPGGGVTVDTMTHEQIQDYIQETVADAVMLKKLGFDMISLHCAYRRCIHAQFLTRLCNHRTDEYGGSLENRSRFMLELYGALKKALGRDFPLEAVMSVSEPGSQGWTVEDTIEFARLAQGKIDILHLRSGITDPQHPTGFTSTFENQMPYLDEIAQVKKACVEQGINIIICASAGFHDLDLAEQALADGKCDLIAMARSWICDPEYGKKAYEGRGEDVVPCIRCNKCHVSNASDYFRSICSVNPILGMEDKILRMNDLQTTPKKVAVVGGGPAGMEAALVARSRGHQVTLFEQEPVLGGALKHSDYCSFKWPLKQFKDYLITQVYKQGVDVRLRTRATQELLLDGGYEAVLVAVGAVPKKPGIPGIDGPQVQPASAIFGHEDQLAHDVVIIGGGEIGVETGMHLAEKGHEVMVLEMLPRLANEAPEAHYRSMLVNYYKHLPGFHAACGVTVTEIRTEGVVYRDHNGQEQLAACGSVLYSTGTVEKFDEAMGLFGAAAATRMIGDCEKAGNVQKAMRSGYAAAMML